jgi:type I restriction enzyme, S subunit
LGMSVGAAQGVINTQSVAELIIPYPSIKEQESIVNGLNILNAETKKLENVYQQKLNNLEELKKSILQKAFNGELTAANKEIVV